MTQDNIQPDTPQEGSNEQQYASLEEAVFGNTNEGSDAVSSAFTTGNEENVETAPETTGTPEVNNAEVPQTPPQPNNDETRYQYWQSQADKYKNELDGLKSQQDAMQQQYAQQQVPVESAEPAVEEFPAAPPKPERPRSFSREDAYADPNSESARYMDEL